MLKDNSENFTHPYVCVLYQFVNRQEAIDGGEERNDVQQIFAGLWQS